VDFGSLKPLFPAADIGASSSSLHLTQIFFVGLLSDPEKQILHSNVRLLLPIPGITQGQSELL
jgi:hypothetical protein